MSWLTSLSRPFLKSGLLQGRKTSCKRFRFVKLKKSTQKRISWLFFNTSLDDKSVLVWLILVSGVGNSVWRFPLIRTMFMCGCDGTQYALACTMHRIPCIVFHLMFMCGCRVVERSAPRPHRHWAWFMSQKYLSCKHKNTFHVKVQKYISCKHKSEYKTSKLITNQTSIEWVGVSWHFWKAGMVIWKQNLTKTVSTYLVLINNCLTYWFIFIKNQSSGIWRRLNQRWCFALAQTNWQQWLVCKFTLQLWMHNESGGMQAMEIFHTM